MVGFTGFASCVWIWGAGGILREHSAGPRVLYLSQLAFGEKARGRKATHQPRVLSPVGD